MCVSILAYLGKQPSVPRPCDVTMKRLKRTPDTIKGKAVCLAGPINKVKALKCLFTGHDCEFIAKQRLLYCEICGMVWRVER